MSSKPICCENTHVGYAVCSLRVSSGTSKTAQEMFVSVHKGLRNAIKWSTGWMDIYMLCLVTYLPLSGGHLDSSGTLQIHCSYLAGLSLRRGKGHVRSGKRGWDLNMHHCCQDTPPNCAQSSPELPPGLIYCSGVGLVAFWCQWRASLLPCHFSKSPTVRADHTMVGEAPANWARGTWCSSYI